MSKGKVIIAASLAALALGVPTMSASAATAGWMLNGATLTTSKALMAKSITTTGTLTFSSFKLKCNSGLLEGSPVIAAPNKATAPSITVSECESEVPNCVLGSSQITTVPIQATEVTLDGALGVQAKIQPQTKTVFATFTFQGEECSLSGVQSINGSVKALASSGQDEDILHAVLFNDNNELKVGSILARIHVTVTLSPVALESWSFL